jgi:hypothetical protein
MGLCWVSHFRTCRDSSPSCRAVRAVPALARRRRVSRARPTRLPNSRPKRPRFLCDVRVTNMRPLLDGRVILRGYLSDLCGHNKWQRRRHSVVSWRWVDHPSKWSLGSVHRMQCIHEDCIARSLHSLPRPCYPSESGCLPNSL